MSTPNFESMTNDELRQKMEEYGLPKVPITSSTRNILIKRLVNHVNGGGSAAAPAKGAAAKRRETMHVVKYSSDDDSDRDAAKEKLKKKMENHKNARRQTLGGAALSPAVPPPAPAPVAEKPSRKSMRATPTKSIRESTSAIPAPSKTITKTIPVTIEDSEEEEEVVIPAPRKSAPAPAPAPVVDRRSKSKTPLSKSDLVTTSYKQVVEPVREEEPIEIHDEDDEEEEEEEQHSDLDDNVPLATRYSPKKYGLNDTTSTKKYSPVKPMSIRISPLRNTSLSRGGDGGGITSSYRYESSSAARPEPVARSSYVRPSLATSSYSSSYTSKYASGSTAGSSVGTGNGDEEDFPYLREFSKRLSTLKAEPLYKRNVAPLSTSSTTRTSTMYSSTSGRSSNYRPIIKQESHWYDPIAQCMAGLENKYRLKRKILILLVILVVIFCVVMFVN